MAPYHGMLVPERQNHSGFYWSKRWWGGSGISWTICRSFTPCCRQITMPAPHHSMFTGRMLFPTPNHHCQSTEGNECCMQCKHRFLQCITTIWFPFVKCSSAVVVVWMQTDRHKLQDIKRDCLQEVTYLFNMFLRSSVRHVQFFSSCVITVNDT